MMSIYAVMVKDGLDHRWVDSLWVRKFSWENGAESRVADLKRTFEAMRVPNTAWIVEMKLEDGKAESKGTAAAHPQAESGATGQANTKSEGE
jgi:hypothetical protein